MKWCFPIVFAASLILAFQVGSAVFYVDVNSSNPTPPYSGLSTAAVTIQTAVDAATNGDLILVNDGFYEEGFRTTQQPSTGLVVGTIYDTNRLVIAKPVTVQSIDGPTAACIYGGGTFRCVSLTNGAELDGFTLLGGSVGWAQTVVSLGFARVTTNTATNSSLGGGVWGMTRLGVGGVVSNCVLEANAALGDGGGAAYVKLINCTLTGNQAYSGGGAYGSCLTNCIVTGNSVLTEAPIFRNPTLQSPYLSDPKGVGGGVDNSSVNNCLIENNTALDGGGIYGDQGIVNCTIVNNSASFNGGVSFDQAPSLYVQNIKNSIIYDNTAATNANFDAADLTLDHCCTYPMPTNGEFCITNDPAFADYYGGDFHLQSDSPCINSGWNTSASTANDLDGNPRMVAGMVDIGAYEYQTPTSMLSYAWAMQYGLPTDGSADDADPDGDGMNNWQEFIAGTNPTNAASVLAMVQAYPQPHFSEAFVSWKSVSTRSYFLQRSSNLAGTNAFVTIATNLTGFSDTTLYFDSTVTNGGSYFYRVGVQY